MSQHSAQQRPLVIAHRGASGWRPEHTAAAYRLAIAQGADAVEPDIVVSRDGVLLIRHDTEISGTTDIADRPEFADRRSAKWVDGEILTGWFAEDFDWAELQTLRTRERLPAMRGESARHDLTEPILSLRELLGLLDAAERRLQVVIEMKHVASLRLAGFDLVELLRAELDACGWADRPEQVIIESFDLDPLLELRAAGLPAQYVFLLESDGTPFDQTLEFGAEALPYAWYRTDAGLDWLSSRVDGISAPKRELLADTELVRRAHDRSLEVYTWTLRPENRFLASEHRSSAVLSQWGDWHSEWSRILDTGVDGVFVDHPELMRTLVDERRSAR